MCHSFQFYFNTDRELVLLTEVLQVDPFSKDDPDACWESLTGHLNHLFHTDDPSLEAELSVRTVKDRVDRMLKQFCAQDNRKLWK